MSKKYELIIKLKESLKGSPIVKAMFDEFKIPLEKLDDVEIVFSDMDVSAKTRNKKIYINNKFLKEKEFIDHIHYIVHELCHYLQQESGELRHYNNLNSKDYLDKGTEIEAFQYQVQFMKDQYGESKARKYVDELIDFHELSGEAAKDKTNKLFGE